eukprot:TRINITY_DN9343_c0_g1_i1.p1 TRINITY_DN9343_c0_g1~~TRINITY_DN9343_c0_g1_i1.p1  ORF type:complete len:348 (+),score=61.58 TRINITY_DN9343_c0_g1_i1:782-1825(+)
MVCPSSSTIFDPESTMCTHSLGILPNGVEIVFIFSRLKHRANPKIKIKAKILIFIFGLALCFNLENMNTISTPLGRMPRECVHIVDSGSKIVEEDGHTIVTSKDGNKRLLNACPYDYKSALKQRQMERMGSAKRNAGASPQEYDGWLSYTFFNSTTDYTFDTFLGYFSVPKNPVSLPEFLYIFTGLQNYGPTAAAGVDIIQPVLQYPADTGAGWGIKSWYVTDNSGYVVSKEVLVSAGDNIFGNMTKTATDTWYVGATSSVNGQTSEITVSRNRLLSQPWACNTIECYGCIGGCNYLPTNDCVFSKLSMTSNGKSIPPNWSILNPNPICNTHANVINPATVDFVFQK